MKLMKSYWLLLCAAVSILPLSARSGNDDGAIFQAIRNNDVLLAHKLIEDGASASQARPDGTTPLMHAALYSNVPCMRLLMEHGADPNAANAAGATALMWSVHDPEKVALLLDKGADVKARTKAGRTALLIAARQQGKADVIRMLLAKGADPKDKDEMGGTALMLAAEAGDLEVVKLLVEKGVEINAEAHPGFGAPRFGNLMPDFVKAHSGEPPGGPTALALAVAADNADVVRFLLEHGAKVNVRTLGGFNPLLVSARHKQTAIVRMLLAAGADPNSTEYRGATPLTAAAASDDFSTEMIALLLDAGADPRAKDNSGQTALDWAMKRGETAVTRMLRKAVEAQ